MTIEAIAFFYADSGENLLAITLFPHKRLSILYKLISEYLLDYFEKISNAELLPVSSQMLYNVGIIDECEI